MKNQCNVTGDFNNADFDGIEKTNLDNYLKTANGKMAVKSVEDLINDEFSLGDLEMVIIENKFETMNEFKAVADKAGLKLSGLGNVDNEGNGDFEIRNSNYTSVGCAICFMDDEFISIG